MLYSTELQKHCIINNRDCGVKFYILDLYDQTVEKHVKMHEYENYFIMTV